MSGQPLRRLLTRASSGLPDALPDEAAPSSTQELLGGLEQSCRRPTLAQVQDEAQRLLGEAHDLVAPEEQLAAAAKVGQLLLDHAQQADAAIEDRDSRLAGLEDECQVLSRHLGGAEQHIARLEARLQEVERKGRPAPALRPPSGTTAARLPEDPAKSLRNGMGLTMTAAALAEEQQQNAELRQKTCEDHYKLDEYHDRVASMERQLSAQQQTMERLQAQLDARDAESVSAQEKIAARCLEAEQHLGAEKQKLRELRRGSVREEKDHASEVGQLGQLLRQKQQELEELRPLAYDAAKLRKELQEQAEALTEHKLLLSAERAMRAQLQQDHAKALQEAEELRLCADQRDPLRPLSMLSDADAAGGAGGPSRPSLEEELEQVLQNLEEAFQEAVDIGATLTQSMLQTQQSLQRSQQLGLTQQSMGQTQLGQSQPLGVLGATRAEEAQTLLQPLQHAVEDECAVRKAAAQKKWTSAKAKALAIARLRRSRREPQPQPARGGWRRALCCVGGGRSARTR